MNNNKNQFDRLADGSMRIVANGKVLNTCPVMAPHIRVHYSKSDDGGCRNFSNYSSIEAAAVAPKPALSAAQSEDSYKTGGRFYLSPTASYANGKNNRTNLISQRTLDSNAFSALRRPNKGFQRASSSPESRLNSHCYNYSDRAYLRSNNDIVANNGDNDEYFDTAYGALIVQQAKWYNESQGFVPCRLINNSLELSTDTENQYGFEEYDKDIIDIVPTRCALQCSVQQGQSQLAYYHHQRTRKDCSINGGDDPDYCCHGKLSYPPTTNRRYYRRSATMMRKNMPQNQKQLSVPEIRIRSLSTPNTPETKNPKNNGEVDFADEPPQYTAVVKNSNSGNMLTLTEPQPIFYRKHSQGGRGERYSVDNSIAANYSGSKPALVKTQSRSSASNMDTRRGSQSPSFRRKLPQTPDQSRIELIVSPPPSLHDLSPSEPQSSVSTPRSFLTVGIQDTRQRSNSLQMAGEISFSKVPFDQEVGNLASPQQTQLKRKGTGRKLPQAPTMKNRMAVSEGNNMTSDSAISPTLPDKKPFPKTYHQPDCHILTMASPDTRKFCHRRTSEQSIEQYMSTACTCSGQLDDKSGHDDSSSDTEDQTGISSFSSLNSLPKKPSLQNDSGFSSETVITNNNSTSTIEPPSVSTSSTLDSSHHKPPSWSSDETTPVSTDKNHGLGTLFFSAQYFPVRKRLRINILKAENLAGQLRPDLELNTFVKVCLVPGKLHKQHGSRLVKGSRNAAYNEEFFFDNVSESDISGQSLVIKVCHKVKKQFQKDVAVGGIEEPLNSLLASKKEVKFVRHLKAKQIKKLGRIRLSTCLEVEARRLTINVFKVDNLPKFGISGAPDPYIRITVNQNGRTQTKQTRTLKATQSAVFKEAVMFLVSVRQEDLDKADIEIAVLDAARSESGDDVIGYLFFGLRAKDKLEHDQWTNTVASPGKEIRGIHALRAIEDD